ncbi:A/G-specific adenine glycosylase [Desulfogranum japonicum]|uniref:A/G-specific adenine glycosylase n=1 Tax=Desulfogranum japonicum TaxID=231447 RepID=UPI000414CBC2|nr:A/G-specific adenine glycosylase [Desulfogranum japonicum]
MHCTWDSAEVQIIQEILLGWFADEQRELPWRKEYDPYHVWISEIMGQQTQMERVVQYFNRWIDVFPDVYAVADANEQQILKAWEGLGYYSRARNLHKTAKILVEQFDGLVPDDRQTLLRLPGIGPYTSAAILSIGYNQKVTLIDANVERVFARLFDLDQPVKESRSRKKLQEMADRFFLTHTPRMWNQALMEFGALQCLPKNPGCLDCCLAEHCRALQNGTVDQRPITVPGKKQIHIEMACAILRRGNLYFLQQRLKDDIWGGLWEFPGGSLEPGESPDQAAVREVYEELEWKVSDPVFFSQVTHYYTRYKVSLSAFFCTLVEKTRPPVLHAASTYAWVPKENLLDYPFPAGHRQLVRIILEKS